MKFDKFAKKVGADGTVLTMMLGVEKVSFLVSPIDNVMMRIPKDKEIVACESKAMPKTLADVIINAEAKESEYFLPANLVQCFAPFADCKQKDLLRIYKSDDLVYKGTILDSEYSLLEEGDKKLLYPGLKTLWDKPKEMDIEVKCPYFIVKEKIPYTDTYCVVALIRTQEGKNNGI